MSNVFNSIQLQRPNRNHFDLSHDRKFSFNMGYLTPCFVQELAPNTSVRITTDHIMRLMPLVFPIMHKVDVYVHYFEIPHRLSWKKYGDEFMSGGKDGLQNPVMPYIMVDKVEPSSLLDYLGVPPANYALDHGGALKINALLVVAYLRVYSDWYRDQNMIDEYDLELPDGDVSNFIINPDADPGDQITLLNIAKEKPRKRAWEHDLFTSSLPWTQKGPEIFSPIAGQADLTFDPNIGSTQLYDPTGVDSALPTVAASPGGVGVTFQASDGQEMRVDVSRNHKVAMDTALGASIAVLRRAFSLARFEELTARGGSRYPEFIWAHFGRRSSDARLQRSEYKGGYKSTVVVSEVLQTSNTVSTGTDASPQGNMAGHAINLGRANKQVSVGNTEEYGYLIGIISVRPTTAYMQGVAKHLIKDSRYDYLIPSLAHLSEQPVQNQEVYAMCPPAADPDEPQPYERQGTFGYQGVYYDYRTIMSTVHGLMAGQLDFTHMARKFASLPTLSAEFIECDPTHRIFADTDEDNDKLICHMYHRVDAKIPLPKYGTPI